MGTSLSYVELNEQRRLNAFLRLRIFPPHRVPVIIPYRGTKCPAQPGDRMWCGDDHQHAYAAEIGPPFVYTVDAEGPMDAIVDTIMTAVDTPIEP